VQNAILQGMTNRPTLAAWSAPTGRLGAPPSCWRSLSSVGLRRRAIPADEDCIVTRSRTSTRPMPSSWPGELRNDGITVAAAGADGSETW